MISKIIAVNRRATFDYEISDTLEAGILLKGTEVKSCRSHSISIKESHVAEMAGALYLFNANIPEYKNAEAHELRSPRKLLLHKKEMNKWMGRIKEKGMTVVPVQMYFNEKGLVKIEVGLAKGKNTVDKRDTIKKREWDVEKHRMLKNKTHMS